MSENTCFHYALQENISLAICVGHFNDGLQTTLLKMYSYLDNNTDQIDNDMLSSSDLTSTISSPSGSETSVPNTLESYEEENSMASSVEASADSDSAKIVAMDTIQNLSKTHPLFLSQWQMMYRNHSDIMPCVLDCFHQDHLESVKPYAEGLLDKVLDYYDSLLADASSVQNQMSVVMEKDNLKNDYQNDAFGFVKLVAAFLLQEDALVKKFTGKSTSRVEDMDVDDMSEVLNLHTLLDDRKKKLEREIDELEGEVEEELRQAHQLITKNETLTDYISQTLQNGHVSVVPKLQNEIQLLDTAHKHQIDKVTGKKMEIIQSLTDISSLGMQETEKLTEYLKKWKKSRQLCYVDLQCANLGKLLYDVIIYDFQKLKQIYNDKEVEKWEQIICTLFISLLQQSFLCISQPKHYIKVEKGTKQRNKDGGGSDDKFRCPKFHATVRLLAAENLDGAKKVMAYFCREDDLVDMHQSNLDPVLKEFPLKGNEALFEKKTHQAVFKKLELFGCKDNFNKTSDKPFSIETKCPESLPWLTVANMLNDKFKALGGRDLKEQEIKHLADRINIKVKGQQEKPEGEEMIQFKQFCVDKMMDIVEGEDNKKKSATFWMWFFAVFNLTKTYLLQEWSDGLIEGFISKKAGEEILKSQPNLCSRTFFLRFSDNIITDGQELVVDHISPFKADKLKKRSLANLLNNLSLDDDVSGSPEEDIAGSSKGRLGSKRGHKQNDVASQRTIKQAKRSRQQTSSTDTKQTKLLEEEAVASPDSTFPNDLILVDVQSSPETKTKEQNIPMTVYEEIGKKPEGASAFLDKIKSVSCSSGSLYTAKPKVNKANSDPSISTTSISNQYPAITNLLEKPPQSGINIPNIMAESDGNMFSAHGDVAMTMSLSRPTTETTTSSVGFSHGTISVNRDLESELLENQHTGPPKILGGGVVEGHFIDRNATEGTNITEQIDSSLFSQNVYPPDTNFYPDVSMPPVTTSFETEHILSTVARQLSARL
ncbi:hypothetical protein KUTeg_022179 [Tegillarca granosa]|uniref:Signal transducer and activator of transcription linker domain-containing protein n=1 Tax=Tegillarca granosa TaxID=220873 RepID=A0ABQ9EB16_TEGGR|nr:hypothetical protein KUTeg_022179 [Tegillarca granosa]